MKQFENTVQKWHKKCERQAAVVSFHCQAAEELCRHQAHTPDGYEKEE